MEQEILVEGDVFVVRQLLDSSECRHWIRLAEEQGFESAGDRHPGTQTDLHHHHDVVMTLPVLRDALWSRCQGLDWPEHGDHSPSGLSTKFHFYRYDRGERFGAHYDGFVDDGDHRSKFTLLIGLNSDFEGGALEFLDLNITVPMSRGMGLVFRHGLFHQATEVGVGRKYTMRTDLMYPVGD